MSLALNLGETYLRAYPVVAARSIEKMSAEELEVQLPVLDTQALVPVMEVLGTSSAALCFAKLNDDQRTVVMQNASPRLAMILLGGLDDDAQESLRATLPESLSEELDRLQRFSEDSAGRLMDRPVDTFRLDTSVREALEIIRLSTIKRARSFYVVDEQNLLAGKVDMQALALAKPDDLLSDIVSDPEGMVPITANREEIVEQLNRYRVDSIPVVDLSGRLVGVVRYQRLFEAIESVATVDLQKMVGAGAEERALSSAMFSVRRRLPWLHINLLTAFLAAAVVGLFENIIAQFTALAVLLPVVAGQSGNAGSQALAVTMRGLALREVGLREWRQVLTKEVKVGLVDGFALAFTCGFGVYVWSQSFGLAFVIAVAMVLSMVAAGISGALVPMILTRLGQDPATAASIILTTVTDVAGFFSFLGTATLLSSML